MYIKGLVNLSHKTGFKGLGKVIVFENSKPFYAIEKKGEILFNLPKGKYEILTPVLKLEKPVEYKVTSKRKRENYFYKAPDNTLDIIFNDNPNKASIRPFEGKIYINKRYKDLYPSFVLRYLILHEIGHYHYNTEAFCDEYARDKMLQEGYNISQIVEASKMTLNPSHERFLSCLENAKKIKIKK